MRFTIDLDDEPVTALGTIIRRLSPGDYADALTTRGVDVKAWYRALDALWLQLPIETQASPPVTPANLEAARTLAGANFWARIWALPLGAALLSRPARGLADDQLRSRLS